MNPEEFFNNAQPTSIFADAVKLLTALREKNPVDEDQSRLDQTWNLLANQVVGRENLSLR
jgi:hypothetical protein